MSLTPKQARFVEEYLKDFNAARAAVDAGYSKKTAKSIGAENLTKPDIQKAIGEAREERTERTEVTQDWIIERLTEVVERCMQIREVPNSYGKFTFDSRGATRALELLGKHHGLFPDRFKHSLENDSNGSLAKLLGVKTEDMPE